MNKAEQLAYARRGLVRMQEILEGFDPAAMAEHCENLSAVEVAALMKELHEANERADRVKKDIGKVYDHVRTLTLPDKMDDEGLDSMKVQGVGRVTITSDLRATIVDKPAGYRWLEEHGYGDLISETVNASSLKAVLRRMIRDGQEVPDDIFKVSAFNRASITKA